MQNIDQKPSTAQKESAILSTFMVLLFALTWIMVIQSTTKNFINLV